VVGFGCKDRSIADSGLQFGVDRANHDQISIAGVFSNTGIDPLTKYRFLMFLLIFWISPNSAAFSCLPRGRFWLQKSQYRRLKA